MEFDVVVVGGGIGGLTVAALLTARGVSTCLFERQSQVGGCLGRVQYSGYDFEPGMGLYTSWGPGEIFERVFAELPVEKPKVDLVESDYVVRLGPGDDVRIQREQFFDGLRAAFPECAAAAVEFYQHVGQINADLQRGSSRSAGGIFSKAWNRFRDTQVESPQTVLSRIAGTSERFERFIASQLRTFLHKGIDECGELPGSIALSLPTAKLYKLDGGIAQVPETLAEAIKRSGGVVRLNSPVLRLAYDQHGDATGVDLLSGERVIAKKAIVSNLTIWDTYGRLVGLSRTPAPIKAVLSKITGSGAYLIYAALDDSARARLPAASFLVADAAHHLEFTFATGPIPVEGKWPATIKTQTDAMQWFQFHNSEEDFEEWDQQALEKLWARLHATVPELGSGIEVIETANPRTFYEATRRKFGMVLGAQSSLDIESLRSHETLPNLHIVSDTVSLPFGVPSVTSSALSLVNSLTK